MSQELSEQDWQARLETAVEKGDKAVLLKCAAHGMNLNKPNDFGFYMIYKTTDYHRDDAATMLLDPNTEVNTGYFTEETLLRACIDGDWELFQSVLSKNPNLECTSWLHETPLIFACISRCYPIIRWLLDHDVDVNVVTLEYETALQYCCSFPSPDFANELLDSGADVTVSNPRGETPLLFACLEGHAELALRLLSLGALYGDGSYLDTDALECACQKGMLDVVRYFVEHVEAEALGEYHALALAALKEEPYSLKG